MALGTQKEWLPEIGNKILSDQTSKVEEYTHETWRNIAGYK
jgi:hypothetical protein